MGWEDRGEHGPYYTRSKRVGGRVVREYVGMGRAAEIAAEEDALERRRREEQRAEEAAVLREERERLKVLDDPLEELCELAEALARAVLLGAGYRRHRGEWRRRRISPEERSSTVGKLATKTEEPAHLELPKTEEGLLELIRRAETGDRAALPALRKVFELAPFLAERCGDLAGRAERDLLDVMAPKEDLLTREAVPRRLKAMREELAGPSPTPMEKLLLPRKGNRLVAAELPLLFTSRWANKDLAHLDCQPVGISRGVPRHRLPYRYRMLRLLAPSREVFGIKDLDEFESRYRAGLDEIGIERVAGELRRLSEEGEGQPLVLLCFEQPGEFCHRRVLAAWLRECAGIEVPELKLGLIERTQTTAPTLF